MFWLFLLSPCLLSKLFMSEWISTFMFKFNAEMKGFFVICHYSVGLDLLFLEKYDEFFNILMIIKNKVWLSELSGGLDGDSRYFLTIASGNYFTQYVFRLFPTEFTVKIHKRNKKWFFGIYNLTINFL